MSTERAEVDGLLRGAAAEVRAVLDRRCTAIELEEVGVVEHVGQQIVVVRGLPGVRLEEVVQFPRGLGFAWNLDADAVGVVRLDQGEGLAAGERVLRTGRVLDVPVGPGLLGRVVDSLGRPLDHGGPVASSARRAVEVAAPRLMSRAPVVAPLQTGIKVIDALIPIGRGQRELILGDRQTGKTAIAVDAIIEQRGRGVVCVYCAIGQQSSSVARVIAELRRFEALDYTIVVVAGGEEAAGLQFVAPYAAFAMGECFRDAGRDVLVVLDDLTRHARAYRELSLLLRRPPGREAFPGDIFYVHARLLERATRLHARHGGGSLTALPICETEGGDLSSYISTNLISITDGQIFLKSGLFQKGMLPAIDAGLSVSRVGGKAQLAAYRAVAGDLRLAYAQFEELEAFARFGNRLDPGTQAALERGRRVREILKQPRLQPLGPARQIAVLLALKGGVLDAVAVERIGEAEEAIARAVRDRLGAVVKRIEGGEALSDVDHAAVLEAARAAVAPLAGGAGDGVA